MGPARADAAVFLWPAPDAAHLLVRSEQMAALEAALFASGLPVAALMEKAALQISRRLLAQPARLAAGVLVLGGSGPQRCRRAGGGAGTALGGRRRADLVPLRAPETPGRRTQASCLLVGDPGPDGSARPR